MSCSPPHYVLCCGVSSRMCECGVQAEVLSIKIVSGEEDLYCVWQLASPEIFGCLYIAIELLE